MCVSPLETLIAQHEARKGTRRAAAPSVLQRADNETVSKSTHDCKCEVEQSYHRSRSAPTPFVGVLML